MPLAFNLYHDVIFYDVLYIIYNISRKEKYYIYNIFSRLRQFGLVII